MTLLPRQRPSAMLELIVLAFFAMLLASCGGGASSSLPGSADNPSDQTGSTTSDVRSLPIGSALPDMPVELATAATRASSSDSPAGEQIYTGSGDALLNYSGGVVDGDNLILTSTEDDIAWAIYRAEGLSNLWVTNLGIMTVPGGMDTNWYAGISNFSDGVWDWIIATTLPEVNFDLTENIDRIVSPLGNMYWVVVVPEGGDSLKIEQSKLLFDQYDGNWLPGHGNFLFASSGQVGMVELQWDFIDGATNYEVYRREVPRPNCQGDESDFYLLGITEEPYYQDLDVIPEQGYEYRVRAINIQGAGDFSNIAFGWAAGPNGGDPGWDDGNGFGIITDYTANSLTLSIDLPTGIEEVTFALTADTVYIDNTGYAVTWDYFSTGMMVFVDGEFDNEGGRIALAVNEACRPEDPEPAPMYFGAITAIDDTTITIHDDCFGEDITLNWDVDTLWMGMEGEGLAPADFAVGEMVAIMPRLNTEDLFADVVQKLPEDPAGGGEPPREGDPRI